MRRVSRSLTCGLTCAVVLTLCAAGSAAVPGDLDTTFDGDGTVVRVLGPSTASAHAAKVQPDGRIVTVGQYAGDFAVARYSADGGFDTSFAGDGSVTTPVGSGMDDAWALALQPDGKIVAAGLSSNGANNDFALARYDAGGTLDTGFGGGDGLVTTPVGTGTDEANAVALQPDGKILVAGLSSNGTDNDFALARYDAAGTLDTGFGGGDGFVTTPLGGDDAGFSVALQSNGMIVVGGNTDSVAFPGNGDFALARYQADGTLDSGFGSSGTLVTQVGVSMGYGWSVALQEDGRIVLAGEAASSHTTFALARYLGDTAPPANPTLSSSSHSVGVWASDTTVDAALAGGSDDYTGIDGYSFLWDTQTDTVPDTAKDVGGSTTGFTSPSFSDSARYLHLRTVDKAGNWSAAVHLGPFLIDSGLPSTATIRGAALSRAFQKSGSFRFALDASDVLSGVATYSVRYRRAPLAGPFGPAVTWKAALAASNATFTGAPGSTYCLSARASDRAGNAGQFGPERCTAIPAGSRQLTRKGAWRRGFGFAHYQSSYAVSTRRGASLAARVTARRLSLVATKCPRCGVVNVLLGRRLLKRIDLHSKARKERQLIPIASFSVLRRGRVEIVVASSGKPVIIEGLGAARR